MTTRMKRFGCLLAVVICLGLIGLIGYGFVQFNHHVGLAFAGPMLYVSKGPEDGREAHFLTEGFQDRGLDLFVASAVKSQADPVLVGYLDWPGLGRASSRFISAVWSKDGSVIACRSSVDTEDDRREAARRQEDGDKKFVPPEIGETYFQAYDFRQEKRLMPRGTSVGSMAYVSNADWQAHNKMIEELIESRGGVGMELTRQEIERGSQKLDWAQWQVYQRSILAPR